MVPAHGGFDLRRDHGFRNPPVLPFQVLGGERDSLTLRPRRADDALVGLWGRFSGVCVVFGESEWVNREKESRSK